VSPDRPAPWVLPAADWADAVTEALASRIAQQPDLVLCLPTGSTPLPVYERLPGVLERRGVSMERATIVLLDEYLGLPSGHPARCDSKLRGHLLDRLLGPPARFLLFGVDGADPLAACAAFDAEIDALGGLDLVVLGLGLNGHVGMNEPGTSADATTRAVDLAPSTVEAARGYGADPPPTRGVTLGLTEIMAAREIWLLATGDRKARILAATLGGPVTSDVPASLLRDHPGLRLLADDVAMPLRTGSATESRR
jgi:glucosamine-6-phosphate deaminase